MKIRSTQGFTLLEVLISLLLLSFALLGLDAMQLMSLRSNRDAYVLAAAENQLQVMSEQLRALQAHAGLSQQISLWNEENAAALPQGRGNVSGEFPAYTVSVFWGDEKASECEANHTGQSGCLKEEIKLRA